MDWLAHVRLHGIARHYASTLPKYLYEGYGLSDFYTRDQIDHAVKALKLPQDYIGLAYAAFLPKEAFEEVHAALPLQMDYDEARNEFIRQEPEPEDEWNPLTTSSVGVPCSKLP